MSSLFKILEIIVSMLLAIQGNPSATLAQKQEAIQVATQGIQLVTQSLSKSQSQPIVATPSVPVAFSNATGTVHSPVLPKAACDMPINCAAPPAGCYYANSNTCSCGTLVCSYLKDVTSTPIVITPVSTSTTTTTSTPVSTCNRMIDCAAPPVGCLYVGPTNCSCGTLSCNNTFGGSDSVR